MLDILNQATQKNVKKQQGKEETSDGSGKGGRVHGIIIYLASSVSFQILGLML
jgi:hypothetical protein